MNNESAILELFESVQMNKSNSKEYSKRLRKFIDAHEELRKSLIDEQKEQLERLLDLNCELHGQEFKEYFIAGYTIATKLITEVFCSGKEF